MNNKTKNHAFNLAKAQGLSRRSFAKAERKTHRPTCARLALAL